MNPTPCSQASTQSRGGFHSGAYDLTDNIDSPIVSALAGDRSHTSMALALLTLGNSNSKANNDDIDDEASDDASSIGGGGEDDADDDTPDGGIARVKKTRRKYQRLNGVLVDEIRADWRCMHYLNDLERSNHDDDGDCRTDAANYLYLIYHKRGSECIVGVTKMDQLHLLKRYRSNLGFVDSYYMVKINNGKNKMIIAI